MEDPVVVAEPQSPEGDGPPSSALPPDAPEAVKAAADGETDGLTVGEERDALDWLLAPARALLYKAPVKYDTPDGTADLEWFFKSQDGKKIDDTEKRFSSSDGPGSMPQLDTLGANAAIVAMATTKIVNKATGRELLIDDEAFRRAPSGDLVPSKEDAMRLRFHYQSGILAYLAEEIRRVSGWSPDRVGSATRVLVEATGN